MKKAIAMLLTAAMSVTLLAGCGGDDGSSTPSSGGAPTGAQDSKESTPADDGQGGNKTLADYEKETNLRVFVINSGITDWGKAAAASRHTVSCTARAVHLRALMPLCIWPPSRQT